MSTFKDRIRGLARLPATRARPAGRNFRTHDAKQRGVLRGLLAELGVVGAVLVWVPDDAARAALRSTPEDGFEAWLAGYAGTFELIDGHMRADELKGHAIPMLVTDLDEAEAAKALATFDAVSDLAGQDTELLAQLLADIGTATESGTEELLDILRGDEDESAGGAELDVMPADVDVEPRTKPGDVWILGRHRLVCGDSTQGDTFDRLMGSELAAMCFTDPPYNADYSSRVDKERRKPWGGIANDNMPEAAFAAFLADAFENIKARVVVDGAVYVWTDWRRYPLVAGVYGATFLQKNLIVWDKGHFGLGTYHRTQHELLLFGCNGERVGEWYSDHDERDVWSEARDSVGSYEHPTQKPVALPQRAIRSTTKKGAIVLDAFGGSGTTLIACESMGRDARLVELDPHYCDVIVARWEKLTGGVGYRADDKRAAE